MSNFGNNKDNGGGFLGYRYFIDAAQKWRDNKKYNKQYKNARNNKSEAFRMESEYITNSFNDIRNLVEKHYNNNQIVKDDKKIVEDFKVIRKALGILKNYIKNSECFKDFLEKQNMNEGWGWLDNKYSVNNNGGETDNPTMFKQLDYYCKLVVYFANSDYNWFQQHGNKAAYFKQCFENQLNLIDRLQENFNGFSTDIYHSLNNTQSNNSNNRDNVDISNYNNIQNHDESGYGDVQASDDSDSYITINYDDLNRQDMTFNPESENDTQQLDMTFNPEDTSGTMSDSQNNNNNNNNRGRKGSNLSRSKQRFQNNQNNNRNRTGGRNRWTESVNNIVDDCIRRFILENKKDNR